MLISGAFFLGVYQDDSENWELYEDINISGSWNQNQKNCGAC